MKLNRKQFEEVANALGMDADEHVAVSHYHYLREDA